MKEPARHAFRWNSRAGFTFFEALVALGVFALAFGGIVIALDAAVSAGIEARDVSSVRRTFQSRMDYCQADPPQPGDPRVIAPRAANRFAIEESLTPYAATNQDGQALEGLFLLVIEAPGDTSAGRVETILFRP
jgi:type II secretory pathway component PulJ